jgi:methyltransferase (TIGR00027 family)
MPDPQPVIRHISDTARWAALYRARETDQPDPLFRDPYARGLAGPDSEAIAQAMPFHEKNAWSWTTRTWLFDHFIRQQIEQGADLVVNLAAGLDARPYRMALPPSLTWIEVDLPGILDYKEEILRDERPACHLERVRMDLADTTARLALLAALRERGKRGLVISEGLLIYFTAEQVATLAADLRQAGNLRYWIIDVVSPGLLRMIQKHTHSQFGKEVTPLQFAPQDGPLFYQRNGWNPVEVRSMLKTAAGLKRLPLFLKLFSYLPENPAKMGSRPWSAVCLLERQ